MGALSIIYCNGAWPRSEHLDELKEGLGETIVELFTVSASGPFSTQRLTPTFSIHKVPSLGHALFEISGEVVHCITTPNSWVSSTEYRSVLESFQSAPEASMLFVSALLDNSNTFHVDEQRDLRRAPFLRILNKTLTGDAFREFVRVSEGAGIRAKAGTFFFRRSSLAIIPPPPGADETSVVSVLPTLAARCGNCLNRSDLILRTLCSPLDVNPDVETEDCKRRLLYSLGWALEWWATQAAEADIFDFAHSTMVPFELLQLACFASPFTKYLSSAVLKNVDLLTMVANPTVDGAQLLRTFFVNLEKERGIAFDPSRVNAVAGVATFVAEALGDLCSVHGTVDTEINEAEEALKRGEYDNAATLFEAAVKKYPNLIDAYFGWAEAATNLGQNDVAKRCIQFIRPRLSRSPAFALRLGNLLFKLGEYDEAKQLYQQSIMLDSNNPASYFNMAIIASREGDFDDGLRHARAALRCQPEDATLCETVAYLEFKCGRKERAVSMLNSLLSQYPQRSETQVLLQQVQSSDQGAP